MSADDAADAVVMLDILNGSSVARNQRLRREIRARREYYELSWWQRLTTTPPPGCRLVSFGVRWS